MIARRGLVGLLTIGIACALASPAWASEAFGVESFASSIASNEAGAPATQAGSHPYALTTALAFNHVVTAIEAERPPRVRTYGDPKDIEMNLPQGVIVNPRATEARCTEAELEGGGGPGGCPNAAAVGVFSVYFDGVEAIDEPVYNMAPPAGVAIELGFDAEGIGLIVHVEGKLRTGADYGLSADISEIPDEHPIYGLDLTLWGDPSEASHDEERGACAGEEAKQRFKETGIHSSCPVERTATPFLTLPSSCTGEPLATMMSTDSWQEPGEPVEPPPALSPAMTGCEELDFSPKLTVSATEPDAASADSPSGLDVDLKLPEEGSEHGLAQDDVREAAVTLPAGMAISPSAAGGREACMPEEISLSTANAPACPDAAKVGTAKIVTPLLEDPLEGSIYLAQQGANPFNSLVALYLVAKGDGMLIKLAGEVQANAQTGQLTVTFGNLPQLPLGELKLSFFGGARAILVTPAACGAYEAKGSLTPWSGGPAVTESSTLEVASGPGGGACPSGRFDPSFTAGTASSQAGASSAFTMTLTRRDGEQRFGAFTVRMPPGLSAILKNVARCPEPQASAGECPPASVLGTTTIGVGPGEDPFYLPEQGRPANEVYLTGPYAGAPFGLSIVVPAIAGPFDLGEVVMRAKVEVDPRTAQLTIASDPVVGGIPIIKQGIPLDIRTLNITIGGMGGKSNFIFNPTSCTPRTVAGTITSTGGTDVEVASPFQAVNCANLPFRPKILALTHAKTSRSDGAYLHVKVVSGPTHPGQANIGKLKVDLPKQLPSRLTTLQKACMARVFEADPAACPSASVVGTAAVSTPMLAHPLIGPAYLVSHSMVAFPALVMVLQSEGVTMELEGQMNISRGITSSTFRSLPDAPIDTLDLVLPAGPHSAFGVNLAPKTKRGLCSQTLKMPTAITAQNGVQIKRTTKIGITGCPPARSKHGRADGKAKRR
jgi:hypothetical protein